MTVSINGTSGIVNDATDLAYTGTLTGGTGVVNLGSGQVYKDASGNVVFGATSATYSAAGRVSVEVNGATDSVFAARTGGTARAYIQATSTQVNLYTASAIPLTLGTDNNERARIDSSGNLLVGTTSQVATTSRFTVGVPNGTQWGISMKPTDSDGGYRALSFANFGSTNIGAISCTTTATSYVTSSDYRLKEDIAPMTGALAKVLALIPVTYKWKSTGEASQGFIAHELQAVVPDCVVGEKDAVDSEGNPQYQGIDTSFLVATLAAAIQELKAIVDEQATRITALEGTAA